MVILSHWWYHPLPTDNFFSLLFYAFRLWQITVLSVIKVNIVITEFQNINQNWYCKIVYKMGPKNVDWCTQKYHLHINFWISVWSEMNFVSYCDWYWDIWMDMLFQWLVKTTVCGMRPFSSLKANKFIAMWKIEAIFSQLKGTLLVDVMELGTTMATEMYCCEIISNWDMPLRTVVWDGIMNCLHLWQYMLSTTTCIIYNVQIFWWEHFNHPLTSKTTDLLTSTASS